MGSNLTSRHGSPLDTVLAAIDAVARAGVQVDAVSEMYRTPACPAGAGPDYVNAALACRSALGPQALLERLHGIEKAFDRRRTGRWQSRTLDLDLLAVGDAILPDRETFAHWSDLDAEEQKSRAPDRLILPHPRLHERAFVLIPLADVAPDWRHPVLGRRVQEMAAALPEAQRREVRPVKPV